MKKILFYTNAYNAEKTIERTINSVLQQKNPNWEYYLVDNGSFDGTLCIMKNYAEKDNRIHVVHHETNHMNFVPPVPPPLVRVDMEAILKSYDNSFYFVNLDADDEYMPDFTEHILEVLEKDNIDIVGCGNDIVDVENKKVVGKRSLNRSLVLMGRLFEEYFDTYHQFMRTVWGKAVSLEVLRKCNFEQCKKVTYGFDTLFMMECFMNAKVVCILAEVLHNYYVSRESGSYRYDSHRIISDQIQHETTIDFLIKKVGRVSSHNMNFIYWVYINAINDSLGVLLNSKATFEQKLNGLYEIVTCSHTRDLVIMEATGERGIRTELFEEWKRICRNVVAWLLAQKGLQEEMVEKYYEVGNFFAGVAEEPNIWVSLKKMYAMYLLRQNRYEEAKVEVEELDELLPDDIDVIKLKGDLVKQ